MIAIYLGSETIFFKNIIERNLWNIVNIIGDGLVIASFIVLFILFRSDNKCQPKYNKEKEGTS